MLAFRRPLNDRDLMLMYGLLFLEFVMGWRKLRPRMASSSTKTISKFFFPFRGPRRRAGYKL